MTSISETIRVGPTTLETHEGWTTVSSSVSGSGLPDTLWFKVPASFTRTIPIERPDWLPVALLMPAMLAGCDLEVDGPISAKLAYALNTDLQHLLVTQTASLSRISVIAGSLPDDSGATAGSAVGTGFSAGVDTFATLAELGSPEVPQSHRLTHLIVNNVGAMGCEAVTGQLFAEAADRARAYAHRVGFEFVEIDSNLCDFYPEPLNFQQSHTIRNAAAILLLGKLFRRYYYSSSFEYSKLYVGPTYDLSYADPLVLPLLSTEQLEFVSAGSRFTRLDKVRLVAGYPDSFEYLEVCAAIPEERASTKFANCGTCFKCTRQILTLQLLGEFAQYRGLFDMDRNAASHSVGLAKILWNANFKHNPNDVDVVSLARDMGYRFPLRARLLAYAYGLGPQDALQGLYHRVRGLVRRS